MTIAAAILYALFVWWFSTGLVLLLVLRRPNAVRASLVGAAILFPICLWGLAKASAMPGLLGIYAAFTAAIGLWGTQEVAFLTGAVTGPRPKPCPAGVSGFDRFCFAICAILYHEVGLVVSGAAIIAVTWGEANQVGAATFLVLWLMRISAKLNLFLGVPVLNDEVLPAKIAFIRTYFRRSAANPFLPVAMVGSALLAIGLVAAAVAPEAGTATLAGNVLLASLIGLAILEHGFMLFPLPIDKLWRWSTRGSMAIVRPAHKDRPKDIERVVVTNL